MFQDVGVSKDLNEHFKKHLDGTSENLDSRAFVSSSVVDKHSTVSHAP